MKIRTLFMIAVSLLLGTQSGSAEAPAVGDTAGSASASGAGEDEAASDTAEEILITLRVPLLSPLFASTPVASVEDEPILLKELTQAIYSSHAGRVEGTTPVARNYANLLDRILTTKLILQEARNIGLDELPEIAARIDDFANRLLIENLMAGELQPVEPDSARVDELYNRMSREFLLTSVEFSEEADALDFQEQYEAEGDFAAVAMRFFQEGRAKGELGTDRYMKLRDLLPSVAQTADGLDVGSVSQIFKSPDGFLVFYVEDIRSYEDPPLREEARARLIEPLRKERAQKYSEWLEERYATVDYDLLEDVSFEPRKRGLPFFRKEVPVDYEALLADERVLATVHDDEPFTVTVADLAKRLERSFYHGVDRALQGRKDVDRRKMTLLQNIVFKRTALIEARRQGLDREQGYLDAVDQNTTAVLFDAFVQRVIAPDVQIGEEEVQVYYREHMDEFSTPRMVRLEGLAFDRLADAEGALDKLQRGADFRWVSSNTAGQVDRDVETVLDFDNILVSASSLPDGLHERAERARAGDLLLYSGPDDNHYVILVSKVFPPSPQPYEEARRHIAKEIAAHKVKDLVAEWGAKLREAYEPRIFLEGLAD